MVGASIVRLFNSRTPLAVGRFVIAFCINTVNRQSFRTFAHILQKRFKRILPSLADFDTFAAIPLPLAVFRVRASRFHSLPYMVYRIFRSAVSLVALDSDISGQTFTGTNVTSQQMACSCVDNISALALAPPSRRFATCEAKDDKTFESLSSKILKFRVSRKGFKDYAIFNVSHKTSSTGFLMRLGEVLIAPFRAVFIIPQGVSYV